MKTIKTEEYNELIAVRNAYARQESILKDKLIEANQKIEAAKQKLRSVKWYNLILDRSAVKMKIAEAINLLS